MWESRWAPDYGDVAPVSYTHLKAKKEESQVQLTPSAQASSDSAYETYIIKPGDTLYQISISHYGNMDAISEICRLNNLKENQVIYPGQMIVLP